MELTILQLAIVAGLAGFSFQKFQEPQMIFSFWGRWLRNMSVSKLGKKIAKPLGACIVCNTVWIGFIIGFLFTGELVSTLVVGVAAPAVAILINNVHMFLISRLD